MTNWNTEVDNLYDMDVADLNQDGDTDLLVSGSLYIDNERQWTTLLITNTGTGQVRHLHLRVMKIILIYSVNTVASI